MEAHPAPIRWRVHHPHALERRQHTTLLQETENRCRLLRRWLRPRRMQRTAPGTERPRREIITTKLFQLFQFQLCFFGSIMFQTPFKYYITN